MEVDDPRPARWSQLNKVTKRTSQRFLGENWDPSLDHAGVKILVIGAGGLGCELLKDLALSGFRDIDVIDMDTIELSNLNRQFLFREKDIGRPKSEVAAEFVRKRVPGVTITNHFGMIQDKDDDFYRAFNIIILGLDSITARQWMTDKACDLILWEPNEAGTEAVPIPGTAIPLIDGGTEGFKGHARVIIPCKTSTFDGSRWLFPPAVAFPQCTLESTPRLPEHCVMYVKQMVWVDKQPFGAGTDVDGDNPEHIQWIYERALARANEFGIEGVTYRFSQGVIKNIIPAIASTNAIVSASCVNEALKMATGCSHTLDNYLMYNGSSPDGGVYAEKYSLLPTPGDRQLKQPHVIDIEENWTVKELIDKAIVGLETVHYTKVTDVSKVGLTSDEKTIVATGALAGMYKDNMDKKITDFVDPASPFDQLFVLSPEIGTDPYRILLRVK